jgi:hypothetical protein
MAINLDTARREISELVELGEWLLLEQFAYELVEEIRSMRARMSQPRALLVETLRAACDENVELREALEKIAGGGMWASVCQEIARAALEDSTTKKENQ